MAIKKEIPIFHMQYPARQVLEVIADKWTPIVIYCLSKGVRRFSELQHGIPDISKKMLMQVLRKLEVDGLVNRKVYDVVPPKTEYKLTELGKRFHEPIESICKWGLEHKDDLEKVYSLRKKSRNLKLN